MVEIMFSSIGCPVRLSVIVEISLQPAPYCLSSLGLFFFLIQSALLHGSFKKNYGAFTVPKKDVELQREVTDALFFEIAFLFLSFAFLGKPAFLGKMQAVDVAGRGSSTAPTLLRAYDAHQAVSL
jgi:hypothetical protein